MLVNSLMVLLFHYLKTNSVKTASTTSSRKVLELLQRFKFQLTKQWSTQSTETQKPRVALVGLVETCCRPEVGH